MKLLRLGLLPLMLLFVSCLPVLSDNRVQREAVESPWTHGYRTEAVGVFVAASSGPILAVEGPNCQLRNTLVGGPNSAVSCDAPGRYRIQTSGSVSVGVVQR